MDRREPNQHPDRLLLPYVENILSLDEKLKVEKHLQTCPECSQRTELLRYTIELLKEGREAFCPELWELYAFVHYRQDDRGQISAHLNECPTCREICEEWRRDPLSNHMPEALNQRLKERLSRPASKQPEPDSVLSTFRRRFFSGFRFPAAAGAAAAFAILLVVFLSPGEIPHAIMAPSTVEWTGVSKPKNFQPQRKRLAIIIALKGFARPLPQKEVDSLYRAVAPDMSMFEQFDFVTPAAVSDVVREADSPPRNTNEVLDLLRSQLGVSRALVITVISLEKGLEIESTLIDLAGHYSIGQQSAKLEKMSDLEPTIRRVVQGFLSSNAEKEKHTLQ